MNANWSMICLAAFLIASTSCNVTVAAPSNSIAVNVTNVNSLATPTTNDTTHTVVADIQKNDGVKVSVELKSGSSVWSAFWGAFFALLGGIALALIVPVIKRDYLTKCLEVYSDPTHGRQFRCRVHNRGYFTVKNAIIYITLKIVKDDTQIPPAGHDAIIRPDHFVPLEGDPICWSVRAPDVNPIKVDIYAKERQPFSPCALTNDDKLIMIPAEVGWPRFKDDPLKMRVFLLRKIYSGNLKVVSEDTNARFFKITIDPDKTSIQIEPIEEEQCELKV